MGDNELEEVIKKAIKSRKRGLVPDGPLPLPEIGGVKEKLEEVVGGVTELKDIPRTLLGHLLEAQEDFKEVDKAFRGTRIRKKRGD